ncbi:MAG: GFA family protein [Bdellovibrionota bacterium]
MTKHSGSCLCKKVSFEFSGDFKKFFFCHCSRCRKDSGSAYASNLFIKSSDFKWVDGKEYLKSYKVPDTRFESSFCTECGSKLPTLKDDHLVKVPAGCLDTEVDLTPNGHIFMASKAQWEDTLCRAQCFEDFPS